MSKRFGRNRKRALLLKLQQLENSNNNLKAEIDSGLRVDSKYYEIIDIISRMIPNSCMIEVYGRKGIVENGVVRISNHIPFNLNTPLAIEAVRTLDLYRLELSIKRHKSILERAIHLKFKDKRAAYVLSEEAFRSMPIQYIVKNLIECIRNETRN